MQFSEGWAKEKRVIFFVFFIWFSHSCPILKKVVGPVLEASKDRDMRRIADFATLRKAPMVRKEQIRQF